MGIGPPIADLFESALRAAARLEGLIPNTFGNAHCIIIHPGTYVSTQLPSSS